MERLPQTLLAPDLQMTRIDVLQRLCSAILSIDGKIRADVLEWHEGYGKQTAEDKVCLA